MVNGSEQLACHRTRGWKTRKSRGASAARCGASARTGGLTHCEARRCRAVGRPAQGRAPAEGVAQYDMAHLFVADAERRTQALGATRMVVEWLVNRRSQSGLTDLLGARAPLGFGKHRS